jgi:hypothetical protein
VRAQLNYNFSQNDLEPYFLSARKWTVIFLSSQANCFYCQCTNEPSFFSAHNRTNPTWFICALKRKIVHLRSDKNYSAHFPYKSTTPCLFFVSAHMNYNFCQRTNEPSRFGSYVLWGKSWFICALTINIVHCL